MADPKELDLRMKRAAAVAGWSAHLLAGEPMTKQELWIIELILLFEKDQGAK